jgi:tRNA(Ile)-lysidine synthase
MIERVREYCRVHLNVPQDARILVACSGGPDSMVLAHILQRCGYGVVLAHCNFQLRGEESEEDQLLVEQFALKLGVDIEVKCFDTSQEAAHRKTGIQETARDLRYAWFEEIRSQEDLDFIATGHHEDDNLETILFQLIRGSGLAGISGIPPVNGKVIRPLLHVNKSDVTAYAREYNVPFRLDSSNESSKYARNRIRNEVLPLIKELNPKFGDHMLDTSDFISQALKLIDETVSLESQSEILVEEIRTSSYPSLLLWKWLSPYGFTSGEISMVEGLIDKQTGKEVLSTSHLVDRDRDKLLLRKLAPETHEEVELKQLSFNLTTPIQLNASIVTDGSPDFALGNNVGWFDAEQINLPITLRKWKDGDQFQPLGMQGHQKISDFLIHQKVARPDKDQVYVLESGGEIFWVIGMRVDERFKVKDSTTQLFRVDYLPEQI